MESIRKWLNKPRVSCNFINQKTAMKVFSFHQFSIYFYSMEPLLSQDYCANINLIRMFLISFSTSEQ